MPGSSGGEYHNGTNRQQVRSESPFESQSDPNENQNHGIRIMESE